MVEKVLKVATKKDVGRWSEAGRRGFLGSILSKHC